MYGMVLCSICHRISATGRDHIDCIEKARVDLEDEELKKRAVENLSLDNVKLGKELRVLLEHMGKQGTD